MKKDLKLALHTLALTIGPTMAVGADIAALGINYIWLRSWLLSSIYGLFLTAIAYSKRAVPMGLRKSTHISGYSFLLCTALWSLNICVHAGRLLLPGNMAGTVTLIITLLLCSTFCQWHNCCIYIGATFMLALILFHCMLLKRVPLNTSFVRYTEAEFPNLSLFMLISRICLADITLEQNAQKPVLYGLFCALGMQCCLLPGLLLTSLKGSHYTAYTLPLVAMASKAGEWGFIIQTFLLWGGAFSTFTGSLKAFVHHLHAPWYIFWFFAIGIFVQQSNLSTAFALASIIHFSCKAVSIFSGILMTKKQNVFR